MNFDDLLTAANKRLKAQKARITIDCRGGLLSLRGTFPPRTGQGKPHQGRIPLNLSATAKNLPLAESKAIQIRSLLDAGTFDWADYIPIESKPEPQPQQQPETIAQLIARFEADYFDRRARNSKSELTWKNDYFNVFKKLPGDAPITPQVIKDLILFTSPDSKSRKRHCFALGALARFAQIDFDTTIYSGNYGINSTNKRRIPTDEEIVAKFADIENLGWRWVF
ncbi:MAG: site-specific integrase, partial [Calothrix sp. MO_167.B42]|nr:site-specific integrase [Calothrix sp. MO_167.B42]